MQDTVILAWIHEVHKARVNDRGQPLYCASEPDPGPPQDRCLIIRPQLLLPETNAETLPSDHSDQPGPGASFRQPKIPLNLPRTPSPTKRPRQHHPSDGGYSADGPDGTARASILATAGDHFDFPHNTSLYAESLAHASLGSSVASASASANSLSTTSSGARQWSTSPVKRVSALADVGGGVYYLSINDDIGARELLGDDGGELLEDLHDHSNGYKVLPGVVTRWLRENCPGIRHSESNIDTDATTATRSEGSLLAELESVRKLTHASQRCVRDSESEAEWNTAVHAVLLGLALHEDEPNYGWSPVGFRNVASARIATHWMPPHASGLATATKMVDFALCLGADNDTTLGGVSGAREKRRGNATAITDATYADRLLRRISTVVSDTSASVNHTLHASLRHRPIAVSIETKTISRPKEEAQVQLAIWVTAQAYRLRGIAGDAGMCHLESAVFPLILVQGATWTVLFARARRARQTEISVTIYTGVDLGDTSSIIKTYQLIKGLRRLRAWADDKHRAWWHELLDLAGVAELA